MKKCANCQNTSYKETTIQHSIKTRDENRKEMHIENLPIKECKICGRIEIPERSEEIINTLKYIVQKEMNLAAEKEKEQTKEKQATPILYSWLKRFIG